MQTGKNSPPSGPTFRTQTDRRVSGMLLDVRQGTNDNSSEPWREHLDHMVGTVKNYYYKTTLMTNLEFKEESEAHH